MFVSGMILHQHRRKELQTAVVLPEMYTPLRLPELHVMQDSVWKRLSALQKKQEIIQIPSDLQHHLEHFREMTNRHLKSQTMRWNLVWDFTVNRELNVQR